MSKLIGGDMKKIIDGIRFLFSGGILTVCDCLPYDDVDIVLSKEGWQELKKLGDEAFGVSGWISVADRLPEDDKWYPILDSDFCGDLITGSVIRSDYQDHGGKAVKHCVITHWLDCPLPEPPKQEG